MIKIIKNMPLPNPTSRSGKAKYPFRTMEVGDAFQFPQDVTPHTVYCLASVTGRRIGRKFAIRKVDGKYFCWRVE